MKKAEDIFESDEEIKEVQLDEVKVDSKGTSIDMAEDYNFVREKLIKSIVRGSEIIDEATKEAKTVPSARAIESASGAVKALTDVSKALIELHEKMRSIEKERYNKTSQDGEPIGDDAGVLLKSTLSDLLKSINEEEKESKE